MSAARRAEINAIGNLLASLRNQEEAALSVAFGALAPSADCRAGSVSVTIQTATESETAEAVNLVDALFMARARVAESAARRVKQEAEAKACRPIKQGADA